MLTKVPTNLPPHLNIKFIKKYLNSGDLARARQLFDTIPEPDVQSWTVLISAYTKNGQAKEAIQLYTEAKTSRKVIPDKLVMLAVAKACATSGDLVKAKKLHYDAVKSGFGSDLLLGNALVDMYGKCKYFEGAESVFRGLGIKDVISWTSFCSCYVNCGLPTLALSAFREMGWAGTRPNSTTLSTVLPVCSDLKCLALGREIHCFSIRNGMGGNVFVSSALMDMYANCSSIKHVELVFYNMPHPDVVAWNVIVSAYFSNGECLKALGIFQEMRTRGVKLNSASWNSVISGCIDNGETQEALDLLVEMLRLGFKPNQITITSVLTASTHVEGWRGGKVHGYIIRNYLFDDLAANTALMLTYAKSGDLHVSHRVFRMMPVKDDVAWNTIVIASSMHGRGVEVVSLFSEMVGSGVKPNSITFTGVLIGCSHSKMVDGRLSIFNSMIMDYKVEPDAEHYSCLVDVLSRGDRLPEAYNSIQQMSIVPTAAGWR